MNRNFSMLKSIALVAALAAGVSGMAHADMGRFDSGYAYFLKYPFDKAPSAWRHANPNGLSELELQKMSSEALEGRFERSNFDKAPSEWRQTHPNGLSERELQALSSEASAWQQPNQPATSTFLSSAETPQPGVREATDTGKPTFAQRVANLLHRVNKGASQSSP